MPVDPKKLKGLLAGEGYVWVCAACGKRSKHNYGRGYGVDDRVDAMWDESCMMNSVLVAESRLVIGKNGRVQGVRND